jgi:hypothetical protein
MRTSPAFNGTNASVSPPIVLCNRISAIRAVVAARLFTLSSEGQTRSFDFLLTALSGIINKNQNANSIVKPQQNKLFRRQPFARAKSPRQKNGARNQTPVASAECLPKL